MFGAGPGRCSFEYAILGLRVMHDACKAASSGEMNVHAIEDSTGGQRMRQAGGRPTVKARPFLRKEPAPLKEDKGWGSIRSRACRCFPDCPRRVPLSDLGPSLTSPGVGLALPGPPLNTLPN
jgi:hypothetical protein